MRLSVSPNGRYFVGQDSRPFFYLGDTAWLLFQRLDRAELEDYLRDRAAKGFTVIQSYVIRGLEARLPDGNVSILGEGPFLDRDPARPNEGFFRHVDHVVGRANALGLYMGLVVAKSWHVNEHPERVFDAGNGRIFGRFLGERYKDHGVFWYVGGDSPPGSDGGTWEAMARGIKEGSEGRHLVSYHGQGRTSSSYWYHNAEWLDFNSIQSGHGWAANTHGYITHDRSLAPPKPTVDMEPPYENHYTGANTPRIDSHQVRKGAWWAMLAGAAGHGYGAIDLYPMHREDEGPFPRNGLMPWRTAMAYEASEQVGWVRRLFELRPWYETEPDQSAIASGQGEGAAHVQAARAAHGGFLIAYLPRGGRVGIHLDRLSGEAVLGRWYDPRDGTWQEIGRQPRAGVAEFTAPSEGEKCDWVLVLEDPARKYPVAPGGISV